MSDVESMVSNMNAAFARHDAEIKRSPGRCRVGLARDENDEGQRIKQELESMGVRLTSDKNGVFTITQDERPKKVSAEVQKSFSLALGATLKRENYTPKEGQSDG